MKNLSTFLLTLSLTLPMTLFGGGETQPTLSSSQECPICLETKPDNENFFKTTQCCSNKNCHNKICNECLQRLPVTCDKDDPFFRKYKHCPFCRKDPLISHSQQQIIDICIAKRHWSYANFNSAKKYLDKVVQSPITKTLPFYEAQAFLGIHYAFGLKVQRDYAKGHELLESAAQQPLDPYLKATVHGLLGASYAIGLGAPRNVPKAHEYLESAAQQTENREAQTSAQILLARTQDLQRP